ncbi:hypothetical protein [Pelagibaculum spongiae]|uniref:hypothetical protein n=1 Tax=Pelagibaculum spongiae TaxID=2080658 RepID=UPI00131440FB|nr:hypothetical protein [Pelagibaculum spongiae]
MSSNDSASESCNEVLENVYATQQPVENISHDQQALIELVACAQQSNESYIAGYN